MITNQPRIAIIGCGRMGAEHARAATAVGARVCLLHDPDLSRARQLADRYPTSAVLDDWRGMDWRAVDAVFVCTPPSSRGPVEVSAVRAGVPVFVEKPVGTSAEQCRELARALMETPVINAAGYMNRYRTSVLRARQFAEREGPIGVSANWVGRPYRVPWWFEAGQSGGPFNEQGTHLVDLCRFLMGEVVEVFAFARRSETHAGVDDTVSVTLGFASGALGTLLYCCRASEKQIGLEVFSPTGSLRLEGWEFHCRGASDSTGDHDDVYATEDAAFFTAIAAADQSLVRCSVADALQTQRVVDAIRRSLASGRPGTIHRPLRVAGQAATA
jgi:myo-inositol 2-dehydrogenase/D-chiro-inositol 1-dehydrogenase